MACGLGFRFYDLKSGRSVIRCAENASLGRQAQQEFRVRGVHPPDLTAPTKTALQKTTVPETADHISFNVCLWRVGGQGLLPILLIQALLSRCRIVLCGCPVAK